MWLICIVFMFRFYLYSCYVFCLILFLLQICIIFVYFDLLLFSAIICLCLVINYDHYCCCAFIIRVKWWFCVVCLEILYNVAHCMCIFSMWNVLNLCSYFKLFFFSFGVFHTYVCYLMFVLQVIMFTYLLMFMMKEICLSMKCMTFVMLYYVSLNF